MTEPSAPPSRGESPGTLLRRAREQQGLDLDALAATVKVRPEKLAALESDHYEQLPDMAFTRALAKTLCRTLKIDAAPVLAGMPAGLDGSRLEQVATGLNTPFRDHGGRRETRERGPLKRPVMWAVLLLMLGAAAIVLMPANWFKFGAGTQDGAEATQAPTSAAPASGASGVVETILPPGGLPAGSEAPASSPASPQGSTTEDSPNAVAAASAPTVTAAASAAGLLVLRATGSSWVEVRDGGNQVLLSRAMQAGETANLDGKLPIRATIGNAAATEVSFRGEPMDLRTRTRDNVARLEFK
ncbi:RodZ domain-containing protein [Azohydromonas australica]|uniref:RodZ domain-containing protein n=1 Tax=Azohydromonas australica TaxID=364039 RepID=UPI000404F2DD|nr:RodZ domain-containing protein [Azohydromonas australica]